MLPISSTSTPMPGAPISSRRARDAGRTASTVPRLEAVIFDWAGTTVDHGCMAPVASFISRSHSG